MIIGDFCYPAAKAAGDWFVFYGQAIIIGAGLLFGLLAAVRHRHKTRNRRYQP